MNEQYHIPVLLHESIEGLNVKPDGVYIDATFGGGGHSQRILENLGDDGLLFGFDQDSDARGNAFDDSRFAFVHGNFRYIANFMRYYDFTEVDGIIADLGVSSHQFDTAERGFSFRFTGELDMRMNKASNFTAKQLINSYTTDKLASVLKNYGEISNSKQVADAITKARKGEEIRTIEQLVSVLKPFTPKRLEHKFLAQIFQALRIEVNAEMENLKRFIVQATKLLKPEGRLVVITYHSLEDRLVKNYIKNGSFESEAETDFYGNRLVPLQAVNRKIITPSEQEVEKNNRARSAKLRIAQKINDLVI